MEECLEDQGVSNIRASEPTVTKHWTKVVPGENGKEANVADYMSFEGWLTGRRGEPVPAWAKLGRILSLVFVPIGGMIDPAIATLAVLAAIGFSYFISYWNRYRCGQIYTLYRGTYMEPTDSTRKNDWQFSMDLMVSINLEKPIGKAVVDPIYAYVEGALLRELSTSKGLRSQPELISLKKDQFEMRFPVKGA